MGSVLFSDAPPAIDALIEERRHLGIDRFDEVWEGVYVVNPAPMVGHNRLAQRIVTLTLPLASERGLDVQQQLNVGDASDFRIPDVVVFTADTASEAVFLPTARIVFEVRSPNERIDKRPFYLAHGVDEVVHVDPATRTVAWFARTPDGSAYEPVDSAVLPVGPDDIVALFDNDTP